MMSRSVIKKVLSEWETDGDGARVRRSIGRPQLQDLDPFLLLDEFCVKKPAGFPNHPHRGFETVTYMLHGSFKHKDNVGNEGVIGPGDLQWMTAGKGVVHSEMPASDGDNTGLQLWVNLRRAEKMVDASYQDLSHEQIPQASKDGVQVKVIAGESLGVKSPVRTRTPTLYLDFTVEKGGKLSQLVPREWTTFAYVLTGQIYFGTEHQELCEPHHTIVFSDGGDHVTFENKDEEPCHFVLVAGEPLSEPVVRHGPFVMSTEEEIAEAIADYQMRRNGFEKRED